MTLADLQRTFWDAARGDADPEVLSRLFTSHGARRGAERFRVYNGGYYVRLERCLREVFREVELAVGTDRFRRLVRVYVKARPSRSPAIEFAGRDLPQFLRTSAVAGSLLAGAELPDAATLADLAELEWGRLSALLAPAPERLADLSAVDTSRVAALRLTLVPGVVRARVGAAALALWTPTATCGGDAPRLVVFYRRDHVVRHLLPAADEAEALERSWRGEPLGSVCEAFSRHEDPIGRALGVVRGWFGRGWIAAVNNMEGTTEQ